MRSSQKYLDIHLAEQNKKHTFALANQQGAIAQLVEQRTENPCVPGSIPGGTTFLIRFAHFGAIAQLVEQRTENPCVPGSIPGGTTKERVTSFRSNSLFLLIEQRQANLGATRPRVGIANLGLNVPSWQYLKY